MSYMPKAKVAGTHMDGRENVYTMNGSARLTGTPRYCLLCFVENLVRPSALLDEGISSSSQVSIMEQDQDLSTREKLSAYRDPRIPVPG